MIKYTQYKTHPKLEYVFAAAGRKIPSVLTGLDRLRAKTLVRKRLVMVLMDLNRRLDGRGSNRSWAGWDES